MPSPRRARALEQVVELAQPRLRRALGRVVPRARSSLSVRCISAIACAAEVGDPVGRLAHALVAGGRAERLRLDDDQADVVRDDVVELLRDPHALLGDRALGEQLALAVEPLGALAQRVDARAPAADVEAEAGGRPRTCSARPIRSPR